jgi:hypothetical protein
MDRAFVLRRVADIAHTEEIVNSAKSGEAQALN